MYRLAPSRWARRPKHPAKRSRNWPSRVRRALAADTDSFTVWQCRKPHAKVQAPSGYPSCARSGEPLIAKAMADLAMKVGPRGGSSA